MEKQIIDTLIPTKIPEDRIYTAYCDNYDSIHYLFVEFQFSWLQQAYKALNDLDKYNIIVYLYKENFIGLNEIFKFKSLNQFYLNPRFNSSVSSKMFLALSDQLMRHPTKSSRFKIISGFLSMASRATFSSFLLMIPRRTPRLVRAFKAL